MGSGRLTTQHRFADTPFGKASLYAPARFLGDFLRNVDLPGADVRYLGLTIGQWGCIVLAAVGVTAAMRLRRHPEPGR